MDKESQSGRPLPVLIANAQASLLRSTKNSKVIGDLSKDNRQERLLAAPAMQPDKPIALDKFLEQNDGKHQYIRRPVASPAIIVESKEVDKVERVPEGQEPDSNSSSNSSSDSENLNRSLRVEDLQNWAAQ